MAGKLDDYLNFNQTALSLRANRQQLLASNIANADTPNFKARDIDFAATPKSRLRATQGTEAAPAPVVDLLQPSATPLAGNPSQAPAGRPDRTASRTRPSR